MDGKEGGESEEKGAAEEQEKTESCTVIDVNKKIECGLYVTVCEVILTKTRWCVFRAVFYCMNEKELVEAAVSYLTSGACEDVDLLTDQKVALCFLF